MTDTNALRSIIADSGLKYKAIAEIMGLTPYALQMKIDNETEFKASEIDTLANTLGMDMQQRDSIFFLQEKWNLITLLQVHPKEVKKMTQNNEKSVVNITVNVVGVQEANQLVERLCEKIKEARTLAGDLTSLVESLEVNIHR